MNRKLLRIYLQDHLAGSTGGVELARRARGANEGTPYGTSLAKLADDIEADRRTLESIMEDLGFGPDRAKNIGFWLAEKAGRLKLNGQISGYSPLSRMIEVEGLITGVNAKRSMWLTLRDIADALPELDPDRVERLIERAEQQLGRLHELRSRAGREAFVESAPA
ncbi:MAG TPA: hypothetical protein VG126_18630 [Thermoleophilaceae bacterium]|nr:hypothetical protein [Thermoleophilaceae bacterium]